MLSIFNFLTRVRVYLFFIILCSIGGTTWALQKLGLNNSLPLWSAGMRFFIASVIIIIYLLMRKKLCINYSVSILALANGLFYFSIPFGTVYWASTYIPSGLVAVLASGISVYALLLNHFLRVKPATCRQLIGVVCAIMGICVVFGEGISLQGNEKSFIAMLAVLGAMGSSAAITLKVQKHIKTLPLLSFVALSMLSGSFFLLITSLMIESGNRFFNGESLGALLYLAVIGSVLGFTLNITLLKHWHISKATSHLFISPVIALYMGFVILDEEITIAVIIGTAVVVLGVMLIILPQRKKETLNVNSEEKPGHNLSE
ncbi:MULTISPECIES: EamA family transporter [unclassified Enterobacter]|jgi:drug/metabolite transporter (DMT)-like permease|uniref:DMT family transporter n=1 Tax=unclassified Enterobacter TaxID=2608935 RepID=UPI0015C863D1|nr:MULTISPECIES: EamA family transporter [unclassified Enterobacter]MBB3306862.1 drug/metabolite transporter (DMT)-like permease [Enterobacter sp. Sphag1F]NYI15814.1 drug/metabolite transporter (DMT)-like permease [Enterobacter sp. Sphag71]